MNQPRPVPSRPVSSSSASQLACSAAPASASIPSSASVTSSASDQASGRASYPVPAGHGTSADHASHHNHAPRNRTSQANHTTQADHAHPDTPAFDLPQLANYDALIVGGGLAGLCAGYALSKQGARVALVEERGRPGGLICSGRFGQFTFDIGAEAFVINATLVRNLCTELGLELVEPTGSSSLWTEVANGTRQLIPLPHGQLGIPARYDDPSLKQALTAEEYARFLADQTLDPQVGSTETALAGLVEARLGSAVLEKIVTPVAGGIHSAPTSQLNVDTVCPGLRQALLTQGSLIKAVAHLRGEHPTRPAVCAPRGGMFKLVEALSDQILARGGLIAPHVRALAVKPGPDGGYRVQLSRTRSASHPGLPPVNVGEPVWVPTRQLVVALPGAAAREFLIQLPDFDLDPLPVGGPIAHVTLFVQHPALDQAPAGSGLLVKRPSSAELAAGEIGAKALTHYTVKWPWAGQLAAQTHGPGAHLLRVSYGWAGGPEVPVSVTGALGDASRLLGVDLGAEQLLGSQVIHWDGSLLPFTPEHRQKTKQLLAQVAELPGLDLVGAWVAGSGISAVVPQALQVARRS